MGKKIIEEENQASDSIDRWGHGDWDFPFGSPKSGKKMSADFGRNLDEKIVMIPSRTIRSPHLHIARTRLSNCDILESFIRGLSWYGTTKNESKNLVENLRGNKIFKNAERENNFKVEKLKTSAYRPNKIDKTSENNIDKSDSH